MESAIAHVSGRCEASVRGLRDVGPELVTGIIGVLGPNEVGISTLMCL